MSKPIYFTPAMRQEVLEEFEAQLDSMNFVDGEIKYTTSYYWPAEKDGRGKEIPDTVTVVFSKTAKAKQDILIQHFKTEIGWHGVVRRDAEDPTVFYVDDILVFPQRVTGATVTPDQAAYQEWLMKLPDEQFQTCRYHGHSHVEMAVSPSGTDNQFQKDTVNQYRGAGMKPEAQEAFLESLGDSAFYIFMIWNKRGDVNARVYDIQNNKFYSGKEVVLQWEEDEELDAFLKDAEAKVSTVSYQWQGASKQNKTYTPSIPAQTQHKQPYHYDEYEDFDGYNWGYMKGNDYGSDQKL